MVLCSFAGNIWWIGQVVCWNKLSETARPLRGLPDFVGSLATWTEMDLAFGEPLWWPKLVHGQRYQFFNFVRKKVMILAEARTNGWQVLVR